MNSEITEKVIAIEVQAMQMTGSAMSGIINTAIMKNAMSGGGMGGAMKRVKRHGKIPYGKLAAQEGGMTKIDLTSPDLRLLDREMRKSGVDFSVMKTGRGSYVLFFKSQNADAISVAFDRYVKRSLARRKKPSIRKALAKHRQKTATRKPPARQKNKVKVKGPSR